MITIIAVSNVKSQIYQLEMLFESMREYNYKYPVHLLVYKINEQEPWLKDWEHLNQLYPEIQIFKYSDNGSLTGLLSVYHNLHRFYSLREHLKQNPDIKTILYMDSDIILTKELNIDDILEDEINYGADINSYNNWSYFTGKRSMVRIEKLGEWDIMKPLNKLWKSFDLEEETVKKFNENTAGVPFLLKDVKWEFFEECLYRTVPLKKNLDSLNQWFMKGGTPKEKSDNGFQSFCSDMVIIWFLLWNKGKITKVDSRLNFAWATSNIENVAETSHIHLAGITPDMQDYVFYKGKYISGEVSPFDLSEDDYINKLHKSEQGKKYAAWYYLDYLIKVRNKNHLHTNFLIIN